MTQKRVALIGTGNIADWHVKALQTAGLEVTAVSSRKGSTRLHEFAKRHSIPNIVDDWSELLEKRSLFDGLVIATAPQATPEVLTASLKLNIPILVEKPVSLQATQVESLARIAHSKVIVGYNRRHYLPVRRARDFVREGPSLIAQLVLPESIDASEQKGENHYLYSLFENSCHGMDLLRFLFGALRVSRVERLKNDSGRVIGLTAALVSSRGDLVHVLGNWGTPANFAVTLDRPGTRFELRPFEMATVYRGMEVVPPSKECPVRRYLPKPSEQVMLESVDLTDKPGFVRQATILKDMIEGNPIPPEAANLQDAHAAIRLCEELAGESYPAPVFERIH